MGEARSISNMLALAQSNPAVVIPQAQLDADPYLVGCQNGIIDLSTGTLESFKPSLLVTKRLNANFNPTALAPTWEKFIGDVLPDLEVRLFMQRWWGYCLSQV